ncbi:MAG: penicillin-binding protein [Labilithrix sp.]|nr:penicillin-binding protein [Labilithrix sp.]
MRRRWMALAPIVALVAIIPLARRTLSAEGAHGDAPSIAKLIGGAAAAPPAPKLAGLDLTKIAINDGEVTAPLPDKKVARLTVDPALQNIAKHVMTMHHVPEAAVVLMDVATGKILVYASHIENGQARDLAVEATAPAASVFKVVTGSALVEHAGLSPDQRECYSGGEQRLVQHDLVPDPRRDRWCTTLAGAMGRSINTVFARLALRHLKAPALEETARALGFGASLPFDVPVQASALHFPEDQLGFARTAAGFWNTTLSPVHAAWLSATVARGGEPVRPVLVESVADDDGKKIWTARTGLAQKRALKADTAQAVTTMMENTVTDGTSYRAFHDGRGASFLPNIPVAGKTGTLTDPVAKRFYTWFTGFAPSHPPADIAAPRQVAIAVLVVNNPTWTIKANILAREVLRGYFASQKVPNVTSPTPGERAAERSPERSEERETRDPRASHPAPIPRDVPASTSTTPGTKHRRHRGS